MSKKTMYYSIFIVMVILISGIAASYAYFSSNIKSDGDNLLVEGEIMEYSDDYTLTYTGPSTMSLNITLDQLSSAEASNDYSKYIESTSSTDINLTLSDDSSLDTLSCTYDVIYTPKTGYNASSTAASAGLNELVVVGLVNDEKKFEYNLSGLTEKTVIYSYLVDTARGNSNTASWDFSLRFYNLNVNQAEALGQKPSGVISIEINDCNENVSQ